MDAAHDAFVHGLHVVAVVGIVTMAAFAVSAAVILRGQHPATDHQLASPPIPEPDHR